MQPRLSCKSLSLGLALLATPVAAVAADEGARQAGTAAAVDLVESLLLDHGDRFRGGRPPVLNDPEATRRYFIDGYAIEGLQGKLGFDPLYDAQDAEITDLEVRPDPEVPLLRGAAQVRVEMRNFGEPRAMLYTLVRVPPSGDWQISDIQSLDSGWSLAVILDDAGVPLVPAATEVTLYNADAAQAAAPYAAPGADPAGAVPGMEAGDTPAERRGALFVILDGSGSMWGQIEGTAKIETARSALKGLVSDLPANTRLGLMAYGHRREGDCTDVELVQPPGPVDPSRLGTMIDAITPRGRTPIAGALVAAGDVVEPGTDVLLVSDGLEVCGGDPCAVARDLAGRGIRTRVHVVGFDLSAEEKAALQCVADNGGGMYLTADTAPELVEAVTRVGRAAPDPAPAPAPAPEPAPAEPRPIFVETFDGPAIDPDWRVENPAPDLARLDGAGALFAAAVGKRTVYDDPAARNRHILNRPLPEGDFRITLDLRMAMQTGAEEAWVSLYNAPHDQITAVIWVETSGCGIMPHLALTRLKGDGEGKPEKTGFDIELFKGPLGEDMCGAGRAPADAILDLWAREGLELSLVRQGRAITAALTTPVPGGDPGAAPTRTVTTESLTALRLSGAPSFLVGQYSRAGAGESHFWIDSFEIEALP
ncbi:vWA domain-containing protein [Roseovarius salinarum]|uniref:vWA domain-containing protein n=1 Tax=Roseovarius salinarum TaxID=1981892 RepID=UPI000C332583|nr:VWA domain-containing protein [Roseovarius salinarum]